jgi:type III secretory pathway component EscV
MKKLVFYRGQIPEWVVLSKDRQRTLASQISKQIIQQPVVFIPPLLQIIFAIWLIGFAPNFPAKDLLFFPMIIGSAVIAFLPYHSYFREVLISLLNAGDMADSE